MNLADIEQIGPYRVKRFIAEGGMAWVFEVVDTRYEGFEVVRALKMLKPEAAAGEEFQRFLSEAGALAGIDHPNLVTIFDPPVKDEATGCFYYTMAYIEGPTLANYQTERGALSANDTTRLFEEILGGLAELHRRKIVHRDIKPANVLIGADGRPRLADLGIARMQEASSRTRTGFALGTVHYMSPEQARGRAVAAPSDVFAVGITLYEALTGHNVFDDIEDVDSTSQHDVLSYLASMARSGEELEIDFQSAQIPPALAQVIKKACRPDPEDRYQDAQEMLDGLRAARERMEGRGGTGLSPRLLAMVGGGVLLLLLAAVGAWWWMGRMEATRVSELLAEASGLETELTELVERSATLEPQPDPQLLEALRRSRAESQRYLADAKDDFASDSIEAAGRNAERARDGLTGICERIVTEYVQPLSQERMAAAQATVDGLGVIGAGEAFPEEFASLQATLPADAAAIGPGCGGGNAHLDRVELAAAIQSEAAALESKLGPWLATAVSEARDRVLGARARAEGDRVEAPAYAQALEMAKAALARADKLRDTDDARAARDAYQEAVSQYETAAAIAPAARARTKALDLERQLEAKGTPVSVETSRILATAHGFYQDQRWKEAGAEFQAAEARMIEDLDRGAATSEARAMRDTAARKRTEAITAGAESSAAEDLAAADASMREGAKALTTGSLSEALTHFQKADRLFAVARDASSRALEDAREAQRAAERDIEGCSGLRAPGSQSACEAGRDAVEEGRRALASLDAPAALRAFGQVSRDIQRAVEENRSWAAANQVPPSIVSRAPSEPTISARRNQRLEFSVSAEDANGDPIRYEWSFEDNRLPETGPTLKFPPQRPGTLQVAALDGTGRSQPARWLVELVNTPPEASVTPDTRSVSLTVGGYRTFKARVDDPDGDAVDAVWKLEGEQVATGASYRFDGRKEGRYELEFVATDTGGERVTVRRSIEVRKPRVEPPPPEPKPEPVVVARRPPAVTPEPPPVVPTVRRAIPNVSMPADVAISEEWRDGVAVALGRYQKAITSKDMASLENIWIGLRMDPQQGLRWKPRYSGMFRSEKSLSVSLAVESAYKSGDAEVTVQLKQTEQRGDRRARTRDYTVELLKRSRTNEWQITKVQ